MVGVGYGELLVIGAICGLVLLPLVGVVVFLALRKRSGGQREGPPPR